MGWSHDSPETHSRIHLFLFFEEEKHVSDLVKEKIKPHSYFTFSHQESFFYFCISFTYYLFIEKYMYTFKLLGHVCVFFLLNTNGMYIMYIKS